MILFLLGCLIVVASFAGFVVLLYHGFSGRGPLEGLGTALLAVPVWFGGAALGVLFIDLALQSRSR